jgi:hypothetical protein
MRQSACREQGVAIVMALVAIAMVAAIAVLMLVTSSSEMLIAGAFHDQRPGLYAAEAIAARVVDELWAAADWNALLNGGGVSPMFADGAPVGSRSLPGGGAIDLQQVVNVANCQKVSACTMAEMDAVTRKRPWGGRNPYWKLYAYGPLSNLVPASDRAAPWYVVLMVADDPLQADNLIAVRAEAFGPRNGHAAVELLLARPPAENSGDNAIDSPAAVTVASWREVR